MSNFIQPGEMRSRCRVVERVNVQGEWGVETSEKEVASVACALRTQNIRDVQKNIGTVLEDSITLVIRHQREHIIKNDMQVYIDEGSQAYDIVQYTRDLTRKAYDTLIVRARS